MPRLSVLLVDNEKNIRQSLRLCLEAMNVDVSEAGSAQAALEASGRTIFDVVFLDLRLGGDDGMELIPRILADHPNVVIIIITAYATIETAVEAIRRGAWEYLPKPFSPAQIRHLLDKVEARRSASVRLNDLEDRLSMEAPEVDLVSSAPAMRLTLDIVGRAATSEVSVLFRGESGSGKGVFARAMHRDRPAAEQLFDRLGRARALRGFTARHGDLCEMKANHAGACAASAAMLEQTKNVEKRSARRSRKQM